jgi:hypothetical protein
LELLLFSPLKTKMRGTTGMARKGVAPFALINSHQNLDADRFVRLQTKFFREFIHSVWIERGFVMK